jgi:hypothetical protein
MPKPKGKAGPSKGYNKNTKRRPTIRAIDDRIPESAIDREPDGELEDGDSTDLRINIDVPVAMWVREIPPYDITPVLLKEVRISVIAIQSVVQGKSLPAWD